MKECRFLEFILLDYSHMLRKNWLSLLWVSIVFIGKPLFAQSYDGLNEASGVNQTLDEGFGARASGMGTSFGGFWNDADAVMNSPASINDVNDFTFTTSHAEKFGEAKFDAFAFLFPLEKNTTLGMGLSRYGISGIEFRPEGSATLQSQAPQLFSTADYLFVGAFARRWNSLDIGTNVSVLYRQLDQDGIGIRSDAMAQYTLDNQYRFGVLLKGLIPSSVAWESGYSEYEPSDLFLTASAKFPTPYFYGNLQVVAQTSGLFQKQGKSSIHTTGDRVYEDPAALLATSKLGCEYLFDFGMAARLGLRELNFDQGMSSVITVGVGYSWRQILGIDYSFSPHPDLLSTHRVSLHLTPSFPKFEGRNFRSENGKAHTVLPKVNLNPQSDANPLPENGESPTSPEKKTNGEKEILESGEENP